MAAGAVSPLVNLLKHGIFDVQKEACWALSNLTGNGSTSNLQEVLKAGAIEGFCGILTCESCEIIGVALDGIENLLSFGKNRTSRNACVDQIEECDGLEKIERLQKHYNENVYNKSSNILKEYFHEDEVELMQSKPSFGVTSNVQFNF